jgi:hypothetical protein
MLTEALKQPDEQELTEIVADALAASRILRSLRDTALGEYLSRRRNLRVHGRG